MPTNSYDLIVVGDDLAGLVAAALCARRGMRTLVIGHHDRPTRYALGPHKLPIEHVPIMSRGSAIERVLKDLGLDHALRRRQREVRTSAQLIGPDARLDFPSDAVALARALEREVPAAHAAALAAWERAGEIARQADPLLGGEHAFPAAGFWERREVARLAARAEADAQAWWSATEEALAAPGGGAAAALALAALPAALGARAWPPAPLALARALETWRGGVVAPRGEGDVLRDLLTEKLTASTGEIRGGRVAELVMAWGKVTSVRLENGEELGAGQVIAALPLAELVPLLGKKPPRRAVELAELIAVAGWRYTLNLVVDDTGVPEGMAPTVLAVRDPADAPQGANAFAVHLGEPDEAGRVVVTMTAVLPAPDDTEVNDAWMARELAALRAGLVAALDDIMPFIASHIIVAHSPHQAVAPEVPGGRGGHEAPRTLPVAPRPLWRATAVEGSAGLAAAPYATGVKNLTIASSQVLPHLGLEGELAAGWSAARIAHAIAGKKKDYLRDEVLSPT
jgi:phytoene dehydrogenase-like protein